MTKKKGTFFLVILKTKILENQRYFPLYQF